MYRYIRTFSLIFSLLFIFTLLFNNITKGKEIKSNDCIRCHEKIYMKALSDPYRHSVATQDCVLCHIIRNPDNGMEKSLRFPTFQSENILYLGEIDEAKKYRMEVTAIDSAEKSSEPAVIAIGPGEIWKYQGKLQTLKGIYGVKIDEVRKRSFVHATISWDTDAFATTEIEYLSKGRYPYRFNIDNSYTKAHKIVLRDLRHKRKYRFSVISRDIYGNMLQSGEYIIDTSKEFSHVTSPLENDLPSPSIGLIRIFKINGKEGFYLRVSTNKPSEILVRLNEVEQSDVRHGKGFVSEKFLKIDICYKCHPRNASHPVGVRAKGDNVKTPDNLPTIEGGIITCITCHKPHGGERTYFSRFDFKKDLCIKCHIAEDYL
ncbi:MAG TPA: hypothetical protein ENH24_04920 [Nitrospirae bacterium]|nr:doubled CXXCH motif [bacterium BMS3Abin06]HDH53808.1 hypothetical protein [Nitrospirota bacterium]